MQDKILEIVVYLMNQITERQETLANIDEMSADLRSMGFTDNEISSAYGWLVKHFEDYPDSFLKPGNEVNSGSIRVLSEAERKILSTEAYGYLLQLRQLCLLSTEQLEMIIDRCTLFGSDPMDINEIKIFASAAMFETGLQDVPFAVWIGDPEDEPVN